VATGACDRGWLQPLARLLSIDARHWVRREVAAVYRIRIGLIASERVYLDRDEAVAAAGLRQPAGFQRWVTGQGQRSRAGIRPQPAPSGLVPPHELTPFAPERRPLHMRDAAARQCVADPLIRSPTEVAAISRGVLWRAIAAGRR
jgi:hypothetical protein